MLRRPPKRSVRSNLLRLLWCPTTKTGLWQAKPKLNPPRFKNCPQLQKSALAYRIQSWMMSPNSDHKHGWSQIGHVQKENKKVVNRKQVMTREVCATPKAVLTHKTKVFLSRLSTNTRIGKTSRKLEKTAHVGNSFQNLKFPYVSNMVGILAGSSSTDLRTLFCLNDHVRGEAPWRPKITILKGKEKASHPSSTFKTMKRGRGGVYIPQPSETRSTTPSPLSQFDKPTYLRTWQVTTRRGSPITKFMTRNTIYDPNITKRK